MGNFEQVHGVLRTGSWWSVQVFFVALTVVPISRTKSLLMRQGAIHSNLKFAYFASGSSRL